MQLGLINSAWVQAGRGTVYGIEQTKQIGFDCIDIFTDPLEIDIRERRLIKDCCAANELPIVSLCCVALGLIDFNSTVRQFHLQRCRHYLDLCYDYGAKNLLLVLGEYVWNREVIPASEQWNLAVQACRELGTYAEDLGVEIALELEPFPLSLLNNVDAMVRFLADCDHPAVKANIDVSHLLLARVEPQQVQKLAGKAIHVHLSDCDGKVHGDLPPGRGVVPFADYLSEIAKLNIPGAISLELEYSPQPDRIYEWVKEAYDTTAALMDQLHLRG
jgi:sugar phosphate isomerase/epimerase